MRPARTWSSRLPPSATTWSRGDLSRGGEALAEGQDHAAQPGAGDRAELAGLAGHRTRFKGGGIYQVRKLRHDLGNKKHDAGRQDDSER